MLLAIVAGTLAGAAASVRSGDRSAPMMWLAILGVGLGSYLLRVIPLVVLPRVSVPPSFDRVVRHAGLAAITALLVASISGQAGPAISVRRLVAVPVASALAIRGASMLYVVLVGGLVYVAVLLGVERGRLTTRADVRR